MSPASYRAAPPRVGEISLRSAAGRGANPRPPAAQAGASRRRWPPSPRPRPRLTAVCASPIRADVTAAVGRLQASDRGWTARRARPSAPATGCRPGRRCRRVGEVGLAVAVAERVGVGVGVRVGRLLAGSRAEERVERLRRASARTPSGCRRRPARAAASGTCSALRLHVHRLDVEQSAADRQRQQVAVLDLGVRAGRAARSLGRCPVSDLNWFCTCPGPCTGLAAAAARGPGSCRSPRGRSDHRHERRQVVPVAAALSVAGQRERRALLAGHLRRRGSTAAARRPAAWSGRRHPPEVLAVEELPRVGHVVAGEQLALHLEQVLRVAQVRQQLVGDLALRLDRRPGRPSSRSSAPGPSCPTRTA